VPKLATLPTFIPSLQAAEHNDHEVCVVLKIFDARYNEEEMFHELLIA
jgi:hypothetical protein